MTPKKKPAAFSSIRIIGEKAQRMLRQARLTLESKEEVRPAALPKRLQRQETTMHISTGSVVRATFVILAILLGVYLLFVLRHKILLLLLSVFVATVIDSGVQRMQSWGIPRAIAVLLHYLVALCLLLFLVFSLVPIIAKQIQDIARSVSLDLGPFLQDPQVHIPLVGAEMNAQISRFLQATFENVSLDQFVLSLQQTGQNLGNIAQDSVFFAIRVAGSVVNFMVSFILVLVLAFFMQMEKERIIRWIRGFLPENYRLYADIKSEAIHTKIGQWVRGEITLMFSIFLLTLITLTILGMEYALTLAVLAGMFELIPAVGPLFAAVPAVLIAATQGGLVWALIIACVYYVIQWCENNLLVPLIMKRAVGLSSIAIIFSMMVGISFPDTVHPVLGILLSVPVTTILTIFLEDWRNRQN